MRTFGLLLAIIASLVNRGHAEFDINKNFERLVRNSILRNMLQKVSVDVGDIRTVATDPDAKRTLPELITSKGYPVEEHSIQTKDGYILGTFRIPHGINDSDFKNSVEPKPVVYLHHGLLASGCDWVENFPKQSLGFLLADKGYDVWIGNARGSTYSRKHIKYSTKDRKFWEFSWDEMALIDLPDAIDYILNVTNQKSIYYVGHSMGTTMAFAMLSTYPEYNQKIKAFMALGPVTTTGYMTSVIRFLAPFTNELEFLLKILGDGEFAPNTAIMKFLADIMCGHKALKAVCNNIFFLISGIELNQLNQTRLPVYTEHAPAGTSTYTIIHFGQMVNSKTFQRFDYGKKENMKRYGQDTPPLYKLENIETPVALFYGLNDLLADPTDVAILKPKIKNLLSYYQVPYPQWTHVDFVYAMEANKYVYGELISLLGMMDTLEPFA